MYKCTDDCECPVCRVTNIQNQEDTQKSINQDKPDLMKVHKSTDFDLKK